MDGKSADKTPWAQYLRRRRLQTWFYPAPNWKGFAAEIKHALMEREISIEFSGRVVDYRDFETACNVWNQSLGAEGRKIKLLYKRLEQGAYQWPRSKSEVRSLTPQQYRWLMEGLKIEQPKAHRPVTGLSVL